MPDPSYYPKAILGEQLEELAENIATDLNGKADKDSCDAQSARYIKYANLKWNGPSGRGLLLSIAVDSTANAQVTARFILLWNEAQARVSQAGILSISLRRGNSAGGEVSKAVDLLVGRSYSSMPTIEVTWDGSNNKLNVYGYHASSGYRGLRAVPIESSTWGTEANSIDKITLYGSASASSETQKAGTDVEVSRRTLPWLSGTSKGSSTVPVYVDSDGSVKACAFGVIGSSDTSSWSSDNTNVPTRAAVDEKISDAMSGNIGGFIGPLSANAVTNYALYNDFKSGDYVQIIEAGTVLYYPSNDRTQSRVSLPVSIGDEIYWTTGGEFKPKTPTGVQIYPVSSLSNWNTLTSTGLYQIESQASDVSNSPGGGSFSCYVSDSNGRISQLAIGNASVYYRILTPGGGWSSWRNVKDADNANLSKTTDATNGDILYIGNGTQQRIVNAEHATIANNYSNTGTIKSELDSKLTTNGIYDASGNGTFYAFACSPVVVAWPSGTEYTDIEAIIRNNVSAAYRNTSSSPFRRLFFILNASQFQRTIEGFFNGTTTAATYNVDPFRFMMVIQWGTSFYRMD